MIYTDAQDVDFSLRSQIKHDYMAAIKENRVKPILTARNSRNELGVLGLGLLAMYVVVPEFR